MLLRAVAFSSACCERLILQSPWIPVLEDHMEEVLQAIQKHNRHQFPLELDTLKNLW